jgi:dihydroflavonol-4-reductase
VAARRSNGNGKNGKNGSALAHRLTSEPAPRRFWVGGATGFLGAHLVKLLRREGHQVVAVSRRGGQIGDVEVRALDVLDPEAVADSARGLDGAFLATGRVSRNPEDAGLLHQSNVLGVKNALAGLRAAGIRRAVVASTSGTLAVGTSPDCVHTEDSEAPTEIILRWPYYRSKYFGEREALEANSKELEVVIVNPSLLLGPGDLRESSTGDVRQFLEGSIPAVPAGGMSFVDARDAASGMVLAFERGRPGQRYLLTAKNLTVAAFFQRLERLTGVRAPRLRLPGDRRLALGLNQLFSRTVRAIGGTPPVDEISVEMAQYYWYCSADRAKAELGWEPRDAGETLRDTVEDLIRRQVVVPKRAARPTE